MGWVVGADGCRSGWIACIRDLATGKTHVEHVQRFDEIFRLQSPLIAVAVDMPIGLPNSERRRVCETSIREKLGIRRTSVFSTPARSVVEGFGELVTDALNLPNKDQRRVEIARVHQEASLTNKGALGTGLTLQSLFIMPKILEVDRTLSNLVDPTIVIETHPELIFRALAGGDPLETSKQTAAGVIRRLELLSVHGYALIDALWSQLKQEKRLRTADATIDDVVDAAACCLTAELHMSNRTESFPPHHATDHLGRPMRIWAPKSLPQGPVSP
ncbi:MAG TPA: DUF429 domain-containing protein [Vineibacter sp.]|nr:DUF429 domain-containing protein [Vineibacter sp.]